MARPLPLLFAVLAGFAVASACYSERQPPPTFRYSCDADSDCNHDESCIDGLCQVECTQLNFQQVCLGANHLACFNGVCSTGCTPSDDDPCPESQDCIELGLTVNGGGFIGGGTQTMLGICGNMCSETSCPEGEACVFGVCAVVCDTGDECPEGLDCFGGYCVPGAATTGGSDDAPADSGSATATDDGTETGGPGTTGGGT